MAVEFAFDHFVLRVRERQLLANGQPVVLGARAFDVLCALVYKAGALVTKTELFSLVWPGMVVEENNLQVHVSALRKLVGPELIVTIPGQGYRFVGRVAEHARGDGEGAAPAAAPVLEPAAARSVAVLPFGVDAQTDQRYFADGMAEDIINRLSRSRWLYVIARNSAVQYRHPLPPNSVISRELGVRYIVSGQIRFGASRVRVTAELIDATRNETVWAHSYDRSVDDLFEVQDAISAAIVSTIEPVYLRREELVNSRQPPRDRQHWELLMRARWHFWRSSRDHVQKAEHYAEQALDSKPDDPPSLALLSFVRMTRVWAGWSDCPRVDISEAHRLALRAVSNDDTDAFAHFTLGTALSFTRSFAQAISEQEHALSIYPQFAAAAGELGRVLAFCGRTQEAAAFALQACEASPLDPHVSLWIRTRAVASFIEGDYRGAEAFALQALAKRPDWFFNHYLLAACQSASGNVEEGRQTLEQARKFGPYSLNALKAGHPFIDEAHLNHYTECLRQAGWRGQ
ncbi:winged helix-turn-helix domain-containing protein [Acidovorax sp. NCPPB 4044]|uniref:winged helix-turn-helix domain-containing protein n=1 Tax=Acidovorax sp. NCPPB 4044 TaxID=2940490 RepID=UPI00230315AC|nr:winged helix-turn-helix domain-containing protein [Acidovorax sp. NCPPB 4044]MDA8520627.1 winged helix-turn-helix domain-containing protein [Acidovorax sp. NCPPB 4044]